MLTYLFYTKSFKKCEILQEILFNQAIFLVKWHNFWKSLDKTSGEYVMSMSSGESAFSPEAGITFLTIQYLIMAIKNGSSYMSIYLQERTEM